MMAQRMEFHRVSRMYFVADRKANKRLKEETCHRIPFKFYLPENVLTKESDDYPAIIRICREDNASETNE